jgi:large subunit ribosomal protein L15
MTHLFFLMNFSRPKQARKRVGRGAGSGLGKTCGRGEKGAGSRAGRKQRYGYEGGQFRTYMKFPIRGFSNARFRKEYSVVNLNQIEAYFEEGDTVNGTTLRERGLIGKAGAKVKILGQGALTKPVNFEVAAFSAGAKEKLRLAKVAPEIV